jgi:hypothetical protein
LATREQKLIEMPVADVYVHYVNKVERKDRTEAELVKVITWLTGFDSKTLKSHLKKQTTFKDFFKSAKIHPNAKLITGSICGVKIVEIEDPLMKKIRYMDKLVRWKRSFDPAYRATLLYFVTASNTGYM